MKNIAEVTLGKMLQSKDSGGDVYAHYLRAANIQPDGVLQFDLKQMWFREDELQALALRCGDVVVVEGGASGRAAYLRYDLDECGFQNSINRLRPKRGTDGRFLAYYLIALRACGFMESYCNVVSMPHLTAEKLAKLPVSIPEPVEQRAIADYLDRETARIDTLIEEQRRLIEMLRERRLVIRDQHLYAREGKRETTLRRVIRPLARPAVPGLGVVTAYRDGTVTLRSNRRDEGYTFSDTEHGYQEVRIGDLVFHALDGFAGAVGISDSCGNATPVYHVCETTSGDDPAYLAILLRYLGISGYLANQAPNVRQRSVDFRNWSTFARVPVALHSVEKQRDVVAEINEQTSKIDTLIAETERFIELARERRSALITAAVTGQIDMREAV